MLNSRLTTYLTFIGLAIFTVNCNLSRENTKNPLGLTIIEPIERDFDALKKDGVIKLITRYNSLTYFLHLGEDRGFEYEFIKAYANENNLTLEVIIPTDDQNPIEMLNQGVGDVIAQNFTTSEIRRNYIQFTHPYNLVNQVVVVSDGKNKNINSISDLNGLTISVRKNSSYYEALKNLKDKGVNVKIDIVSEDLDTEYLIQQVSDGAIEATIADDNLFQAVQSYLPDVQQGPSISGKDTVAWAIRKNAPLLEKSMNKFLKKHYRIRDDDTERRSAFLNILRQRYFNDFNQVSTYREVIQESKYSGVLSPYDKLIRPIADSVGIDWRLVVAIVAQESRFNPYAKSWAGAIGLMQVNHRFSKYSEDELYDLEINVKEGVRILKENLDHYSYLDSSNQWSLALATYNAGVGHVSDARRIAIDLFKNPNEWEHIADGLLKLMRRQYYKDARYGFCRGIETVHYVRGVSSRFEMYKTIHELSQRNESGDYPGVIGVGRLIRSF